MITTIILALTTILLWVVLVALGVVTPRSVFVFLIGMVVLSTILALKV